MQTAGTFIVAVFALSQFSFAGEPTATPHPSWRDVNTHHLFIQPENKKAWEKRAAELREQILVSAGLSPMPQKCALNPRVTGKYEAPDFTVENVAIETFPGFYLCGNLYRPKGKQGPFPAIVNPHGHWNNGRLQIEEDVAPPEAGAKPAKGKANLVAIGVNLARQGFVVFAYDMIGYNDTNQIPKHREFANTLQPWLWGVSLNGMQLWNSIRVVDYLSSLSDVDASRIGVTGASGGGTQTFLLSAIDERIKAAVPVNMVSTYMQGGCLCENGPGLRVGTDNAEIAALFAPKPLLLVAATGDWTAHNPEEEWPAIRKIYDLYKAPEKTLCKQFNYQHNYNIESREAMYAWFGRWLLNDTNPQNFREKPFTLDTNAMHVWNEKTPLPATALKDAELIKALIAQSETMFDAITPRKDSEKKAFSEQMKPALATSLSVNLSEKRTIDEPFAEKLDVNQRDVTLIVAPIEKKAEAESLAKAFNEKQHAAAVLLLEPNTMSEAELWKDFFSCYNRTPLGNSVQKILDAIESIRRNGGKHQTIVAIGEAGVPTLLARGLSHEKIHAAVIDLNGLDNSKDDDYLRHYFAPGLRRVGDIRTAILLAAGESLWLANYNAFSIGKVADACDALKSPITCFDKMPANHQIVEHLLKK